MMESSGTGQMFQASQMCWAPSTKKCWTTMNNIYKKKIVEETKQEIESLMSSKVFDLKANLDVVPGQVVLALLLVTLKAWTVVGSEVGHDVWRALLDEEAQRVHLSDTLLTVESGAEAGHRQQEDELQHRSGGGGVGGGSECLEDTEDSQPHRDLYRQPLIRIR